MARPAVLVVLPHLVLATLLATANAQSYIAPTPSPLTEEPDSTSPPPPPPESSSSPPAPPPPPAAASNDWTPVANVNDTTIQQVAQFAVRMEALSSRERNDMQLLKVVSGETQPSGDGYNYRLLVITVSGGKQTQYEAFVWGILGTTSWKLLSFTPK